MIIAIVGMVHEFDLLPYYLRHYRELGVDRFAIACNPTELDPTHDLNRMLDLQSDVEVINLPHRFQRSNLVGMIEEEVRPRFAKMDAWLIPTDLDEFNQYPSTLPELIRQMNQDGSTHVVGTLRDRLAPEGILRRLRPFDDGVSIWDQYPLEGDVTARVTGGCTDKVLLSRADLAWSMGHHRMRDAPILKPFTSTGTTHHFKWRDSLTRTLEWRVENEERAGVPWSIESVRLCNYVRRHGRIPPEEVSASIGWRPKTGGPASTTNI